MEEQNASENKGISGGAIAAIGFGLLVLLGVVVVIVLAAMGKFNSSPPTPTPPDSPDNSNDDSNDNSNDNSKNKDKHNSKDKDKHKHKDDSDDSDDSGNSKNNKTVKCKSDDDCKNNSKNKTCNLDCVDSKQNNKCVYIGCPSVPCTKNSDCQGNTSKTVCDLKKKVCGINPSIIITGKNGKSITLDPKNMLDATGQYQTQTGCFSLDENQDWKDALKSGANCNVKSITLPEGVKATTYTTSGGWYNICSDNILENIDGGSVDHNTKDKTCGFKFERSDT
jgi:hypothetical protein